MFARYLGVKSVEEFGLRVLFLELLKEFLHKVLGEYFVWCWYGG